MFDKQKIVLKTHLVKYIYMSLCLIGHDTDMQNNVIRTFQTKTMQN